ncbi:helix-turn-helix domain-containing protein [Leuconostoc suionicum]|uniref:helix-turn-helix domain-containing protein n=1 Tax=Leuconostoc suionicum TaxID=1511761 RepID=UPI0021A431D5|nr:helix-turn-helix transcriptional regulator [Leuconostoc suionicum]MCT4376192.1 XRE family transcriptional regulator [Leuconostoc suionicum]
MDISSILKKKRSDHKLTQEQLAEKIFVPTKTISNWENNKTTPDIDSLIILAQLFDLSLDNLLLKGSNIVENIKKQADIRSTKMYLNFATITDLACLIYISNPTNFW